MCLIVRYPVTVVAGLDDVEHEQNDVDHVPDAEAAECDELADADARVSDAASVDGEYAQEDRVEKRRHEIFVRIAQKAQAINK